ncbi:inositol monophosphatase family protein [Streptomyces sp. HPF1205]|uniref:inositol monophosphatase family protein n=1 Tax=Streptomyces sp. HPF1205 TaxID=2873262 RepID=UPI001CECC0A7|nr:inositol monophosphatase family protein [Streptomyces sp. HPF1205]
MSAADRQLLEPMTEAVHAVGVLVRTLDLPPEPARDREEFLRRFRAVDVPALALMRERLGPLRPGAVWADELDTRLPERGEVWVADAVDGAVQFLQGLPHWCVSLTLVREGRAVAAVLHSPLLGETCNAVSGGGARRDGRPMRPSGKRTLDAALLGTSQPPGIAREPEAVRGAGRSLSALLPKVGAVRNLGATSWQITDTAAGRMDGFWQYGTDDANLVGPALIAAEAGLVVTDLAGRPWRAGADGFLAAPRPLHPLILDAILG